KSSRINTILMIPIPPFLPLTLISINIYSVSCLYVLLTDGMFGRCHSVPVKEVYIYDVSPFVVQRFRIMLEKLSNRGIHTDMNKHNTCKHKSKHFKCSL
uniref:Uncharacterized protein n=1 Tax=Sphaeramia orbicularis TaxID=375764 RepID=A0A673A4B0_9TELE